MMKGTLLYIMVANLFSNIASAQSMIPLYDKIPNSKPGVNKETAVMESGILLVKNISVPTITMYPSVKEGRSPAVVICPGGAYRVVAAGHEGEDVAKVLASWGITAFVLRYRLPDEEIMIDRTIGPLQDAQRAIQLVRDNAKEWKIDPAKVGIMGFSAGGHLASTASTHFTKAVIANVQQTSLRPDFSILAYPVISFNDSLAHIVCRAMLLGTNQSPKRIKDYSNDLQVTVDTPPTFIVHARDDESVKLGHSLAYKKALEEHEVPVELHVYEKGGHGFGMKNPLAPDDWMDHLKKWLVKQQVIAE